MTTENEIVVSNLVSGADIFGAPPEAQQQAQQNEVAPVPTTTAPTAANPTFAPTVADQQQAAQVQQQKAAQQLQQQQQAAELANSVDLATLTEQLNAIVSGTQQQSTGESTAALTQQQNVPQVDTNAPGFAELNQQFQAAMGVDLQTGLNNYQQLVNTAQDAIGRMAEMQRRMQLMQAHTELQNQWVNDPDIQRQMQQGTPLSQAVQERMQYLARIHRTLPEETRNQVDSMGVQGITELWKNVSGRAVVQQMPNNMPGVVQPTARAGKQHTWSEIASWPEDRFIREGMQLLDSGNFIDDRQQRQTLR